MKPVELLRTVEILATVLQSRVALRLRPERELAWALAAPDPAGSPDPSLVELFRRVTRRISHGRCLLLSLALVRVMRRRGMAAVVRIGFDESNSGHAWVECNGRVQGEPPAILERFRSFNVPAAAVTVLLARLRQQASVPASDTAGSKSPGLKSGLPAGGCI